MADQLIIQMFKQKRAEISGMIAAYQAKIEQAQHELAYINAVLRLVEGGEQERAQSSLARRRGPVHRPPGGEFAPISLTTLRSLARRS
ncbi:hypothetical protein [Bradyrhizobium sp.]|jgi:hypothetical protein|uniref:hypothetical protein n=1 Tax=Bradyrhizobium sp. TaxID=376 RepID=UPI00054D3644|nr:hypothetical protein [Bradyrhizobium sp.]MBI5322144.1 hypothetical protein [Bradyrhizobium sp.]MBR2119737.1 hypothetical protein [Afipia sp.]HAR14376.1 hypothetical protein [Bradyrhizobium sp.]HAR22895.1 hypothetical protein [Bradyrhizobium sp.]